LEREQSDAAGVRGAAGMGGNDWVREVDSPKPAAADQTRYTFKDLTAAWTKSIAMTGADKASTQK